MLNDGCPLPKLKNNVHRQLSLRRRLAVYDIWCTKGIENKFLATFYDISSSLKQMTSVAFGLINPSMSDVSLLNFQLKQTITSNFSFVTTGKKEIYVNKTARWCQMAGFSCGMGNLCRVIISNLIDAYMGKQEGSVVEVPVEPAMKKTIAECMTSVFMMMSAMTARNEHTSLWARYHLGPECNLIRKTLINTPSSTLMDCLAYLGTFSVGSIDIASSVSTTQLHDLLLLGTYDSKGRTGLSGVGTAGLKDGSTAVVPQIVAQSNQVLAQLLDMMHSICMPDGKICVKAQSHVNSAIYDSYHHILGSYNYDNKKSMCMCLGNPMAIEGESFVFLMIPLSVLCDTKTLGPRSVTYVAPDGSNSPFEISKDLLAQVYTSHLRVIKLINAMHADRNYMNIDRIRADYPLLHILGALDEKQGASNELRNALLDLARHIHIFTPMLPKDRFDDCYLRYVEGPPSLGVVKSLSSAFISAEYYEFFMLVIRTIFSIAQSCSIEVPLKSDVISTVSQLCKVIPEKPSRSLTISDMEYLSSLMTCVIDLLDVNQFADARSEFMRQLTSMFAWIVFYPEDLVVCLVYLFCHFR